MNRGRNCSEVIPETQRAGEAARIYIDALGFKYLVDCAMSGTNPAAFFLPRKGFGYTCLIGESVCANLSFVCELLLKSLIVYEEGTMIREHRLWELYDLLSEASKTAIETEFASYRPKYISAGSHGRELREASDNGVENFKVELEANSDMFVFLRYWYERRGTEENYSLNRVFFSRFVDALMKRAKEEFAEQAESCFRWSQNDGS